MIDPQAEWDHPRVVQIRELETAAAKFAQRVFAEVGPGEATDLAFNTRIALSRMLAPYRHGIGEQYRKLRTPLSDPTP